MKSTVLLALAFVGFCAFVQVQAGGDPMNNPKVKKIMADMKKIVGEEAFNKGMEKMKAAGTDKAKAQAAAAEWLKSLPKDQQPKVTSLFMKMAKLGSS